MAHPLKYSNADKEKLEKSPDREPRNIYPTPQHVADAFTNYCLNDWLKVCPSNLLKHIDPGSGTGVFGTSIAKWGDKLDSYGVRTRSYGFDIRGREETGILTHYDSVSKTDIFDRNSLWWLQENDSIVLGNPPYHESWRKMVSWIARTIKTYDYVGLLMPTDWRHGINRKEDVYDIRMPKFVLDSSLRIDFTGKEAQTRNFAFWWWSRDWGEYHYMGIPFNYREWCQTPCVRCGDYRFVDEMSYPHSEPVCPSCMEALNGNPFGK